MAYSDDIINKANSLGRGLTKSERAELREAYLWEKETERRNRDKIAKSVSEARDEKNPLDLPRHRMHTKCPSFSECPVDLKCKNYNSAYLACVNCELHETNDICMKKELHNERNLSSFFSTRERIDLDERKDN